jgi:hypothetical protein
MKITTEDTESTEEKRVGRMTDHIRCGLSP